MSGDPTSFRRSSIRMKGYDYTSEGAYFVTIVARERECLFGEIVDGEIKLNDYDQIVVQTCVWLVDRYQNIMIEPYIVMPNHFHGVFWIGDVNCRGGSRPAPAEDKIRKPLGQIIGVFKTVTAKKINILRMSPGISIWQRNYYEHIIRNQDELEKISAYILSNPENWATDQEYQT